ncbi:MAG: PP2C family protein-serine/threonine phosphatase, partial [Vicinamibacterales bacterium]
ILPERQLEEYYCTLSYASFDLKHRTVTISNSGLPYPVRSTAEGTAQVELPGVPLGSFGGSSYDEASFALTAGDVFVFCSDGIFEAFDTEGREFGARRLIEVVSGARDRSANDIVQAIFGAATAFRGDAEQTDDMTAVVVKITV